MWSAKTVAELCGEQFELGAERLVDHLFDTIATLPGSDDLRTAPFLEVPFIGGPRFWAGHDPPALRERVIRALCAREKFRREAPAGSLELPIDDKAIMEFVESDDIRMNLVGLFGRSQSSYWEWDPRHPRFHRYCCGLMACEATPQEIRCDSTLMKEFAPWPLPGFEAESLAWISPERWRWKMQMKAMMAAAVARGAMDARMSLR